MYEPQKFLTVALASEVLQKLDWPVPYVFEDWLPDGVAMVFPNCTLMFSEGFESDMDLTLSAPEAAPEDVVVLADFLLMLRATADRTSLPREPTLTGEPNPQASREKVESGLHNLALLALTFAHHCILGDFSWMESYKAFRFQTS
jgi:hypothetical protein